MPRANRHYLPGHVWHLTHRCHRREFLLKFARDRRCWESWLFEARKRFGLSVLNYVATSNHVHLLVHGGTGDLSIPRAVQLLAGRTAQEYNLRKGRRGAFWEDRYHATAVESGEHLARCMVYISLNMVRAGVVGHPSEWECCGYHEIESPPERYARIDRVLLARLLGLSGEADLPGWQRGAVEAALSGSRCGRRPEWTEAVAVGGASFVSGVREGLGMAARGRTEVPVEGGGMVLRESRSAYSAHFEPQNELLSLENALFWRIKH